MPVDTPPSARQPKGSALRRQLLKQTRMASAASASSNAYAESPFKPVASQLIAVEPAKPKPPRASYRQRPELGTLPEQGFVRLPQILAVYPISRAAWWAGVADGTLPAGVLLSKRVRAWSVESIRQLIAKALAAA